MINHTIVRHYTSLDVDFDGYTFLAKVELDVEVSGDPSFPDFETELVLVRNIWNYDNYVVPVVLSEPLLAAVEKAVKAIEWKLSDLF